MEVSVLYDREEINQKIPFPVIVENWKKKEFGKGKREYNAKFTDKEKATITAYISRFRKWYLIGTPEKCNFVLRNVILLERAGNFFASI